WQDVDVNKNYDVLDNIPEIDDELAPENVRPDGLVDRLPFLKNGLWEKVHIASLVPKEKKEIAKPPAGFGAMGGMYGMGGMGGMDDGGMGGGMGAMGAMMGRRMGGSGMMGMGGGEEMGMGRGAGMMMMGGGSGMMMGGGMFAGGGET